ncbi:MAG: PfkB family carbohydrate kinase [Acholeplasmataceae bacterium]|jgi:2-dehydro-3-deoxygluconokinase|nr:PfkB family carbohydrate kinase [Acholeplasmataceae bacterium]
MEFIKKFKYALVAPSSMGVRITPINRQPVHTSDVFHMKASSSESNVLSISSALGLPTKVLTTFVKDSSIALLIKNDLMRRGIHFEGKEVDQDGPWGYRHQFNIADSGYGLRAPRVQNDRAGEVGRTLSIKDFDIENIFGTEGIQLLHMSGLIAALSKETSEFCLLLAKAAKEHGTKISFDLNYRATFWKNRVKELREIFHEIASIADILIGNEEDFQLALGIEGPKAGGKQISDEIESFKGMIHNVKKAYPNAQTFATTLREVESANDHLWGAILLDQNEWTIIEPRPIPVLDRIGGGDGFVGGLLYGLLKGWESKKCAEFAWATGALATTVLEDYALPADEAQVWSIFEGNARVQR